eukprot:7505340-Pyramimonas_sp.AAC.1
MKMKMKKRTVGQRSRRAKTLEQLARLPSGHPDREHIQSCTFGKDCLHCKWILLEKQWKWNSTFVVPGTSMCWLKPVIKRCDDIQMRCTVCDLAKRAKGPSHESANQAHADSGVITTSLRRTR